MRGITSSMRRAWRDHGRKALWRLACRLGLQVVAALLLLAVLTAMVQAALGAVCLADAAQTLLPKPHATK
jgi:uncharacterized BrkB/YihY/UPF0761 family membrane protein